MAISVTPISTDQVFLLTDAGCRILDLRNNQLQVVPFGHRGSVPGLERYGAVATLEGKVLLMGRTPVPYLYDPASGAWQQLRCGPIGPHVPRINRSTSGRSLSAVVSLPAF